MIDKENEKKSICFRHLFLRSGLKLKEHNGLGQVGKRVVSILDGQIESLLQQNVSIFCPACLVKKKKKKEMELMNYYGLVQNKNKSNREMHITGHKFMKFRSKSVGHKSSACRALTNLGTEGGNPEAAQGPK